MADTVIRQVQDSATEVKEPHIEGKDPDVDGEAKVDTPYTEYEAENGIPYVAEHFKLGEKWEVFVDEVSAIEDYIDELIKTGKLENTTKAVDELLTKMEMLTNVGNENRSVIKIETIKAHIDFLTKTDNIYKDFARYGN